MRRLRIQRAVQAKRYQRGIHLFHAGKLSEAVGVLQSLRHRNDLLGQMARYHCGIAHRQMGLEFLRRGEFDAAEKHLRAAVDDLGRQAELSSYLASLYARTERPELCAEEMQRCAEIEPDNPEFWRKLALALWRDGRREQAYMTLTSAIRRLENVAPLEIQLGLFYAAEGMWNESCAHLRRAAQSDDSDADAHYYLGLALAATKEPAAAAGSLQRAMELRPNDLVLAYQLHLAVRAAAESGVSISVRLPNAAPSPSVDRSRLAEYVSAEPDFVDAMLGLPVGEADADVLSMLSDVLAEAIAAHPDEAVLHYHRSRVLDRLGETSEARDHARQALRIRPRYIAAMTHLSSLYEKEGRPEEAIACLQRAIGDGADWPDVHCLAGELMARHHYVDGAKRHLERALQLKPNYTRATKAMARLAA
jgi:tetratricopeptide (TPR) repeat protein